MALLPDALVNAPRPAVAAGVDVLGAIDAHGYGVLQLPPPGRYGLLLAVIADQVAEYAHHGYVIVAVGVAGDRDGLHWRRLGPLLARRGAALPPRHGIRPQAASAVEARRLNGFLAAHEASAEERRSRPV
jgi:hypothetical protein